LWFAVFMGAICWNLVMPFMPDYLGQLGVTHGVEMWSGIIIAASAVCSMISAPIWGAMGDRYGRRMMLLRAGVFLVIGYVWMALVRGPWDLLLDRMMIGGFTGFVPMAIALIGVSTPQEHMAMAMGMIQTAWPSGQILGPVIGGVLADWVGIPGSSWISAVLMAITVALVVWQVKEEFAPPKAEQSSLIQDLQVAASNKVILAIVLITTAANAAVMALEPVVVPFVKQLEGPNAPSWMSGLIFSLPGVAFIVMAGWWVRRGEKSGFATTVAAGMLGSGLLYLLQAFVTGPWQLVGLRMLSGVTGAAIGPGVASLISTAVPRDLRGRAFGLNQSAASLGNIVGPLIGGYLGSFVSARGVFVFAGLLYGLGALWTRTVVASRMPKETAGGEAGSAVAE
jgi:MFS family permease